MSYGTWWELKVNKTPDKGQKVKMNVITYVASYDFFTFFAYHFILVFVNICFGLCSESYIALLAKALQPHLHKNVDSS